MKDLNEERSPAEVAAKPKAFSYLRFSTPEQERGDSFRRQTALAEAYAEKHGLELDQELTFRDLGVSAFRGRNSKKGALGQFISAIDRGLVPEGSYLLVESLDRLSREAPYRAVGTLRDIVDEGITVVTLTDGKAYSEEALSSEDGFMSFLFAVLTMQRAHEESQIKGRRLAAAWENKRERAAKGGHRLTKLAPAWLRPDDQNGWIVIDDQAETVRTIFEMSAEGIGRDSIAKQLNRSGVAPLGRGKRWHPSSVQKILTNPAAVGTLVPHKIEYEDGKRRRKATVPIPSYFPAIIETELWDRVQGRLQAGLGRGRHAANRTIRNSLARLATCPACGANMTRVAKGKRSRPKLICSAAKVGAGCKYVSVDLERVEQALIEQGPGVAAEVSVGAGAKAAQAALEGVEDLTVKRHQQLDHILTIEAEGRSSPALTGKRRQLEADIEALQQEADNLRREIEASADQRVASRRDAVVDALARGQSAGLASIDRKAINDAMVAALERVVIDYRSGELVFHWRHKETSSILYEWPMWAASV